MVNLRTTKALNKFKSVFLAFLIVSLLFSQIPSPALAGPRERAGATASEYAKTLDQVSSGIGVARSVLKMAETDSMKNRPKSIGEASRETHADLVFTSIVSEFTDKDTYIAPTFIAGNSAVVNSVVFDDVGPCVPVFIPATRERLTHLLDDGTLRPTTWCKEGR